jgi:hypothetical protein
MAIPETVMSSQLTALQLQDLGWDLLSEHQQLLITREALRRAAETIAGQAEVLACEMEIGTLSDRGGPDALRLLAAFVRLSGQETQEAAGHA